MSSSQPASQAPKKVGLALKNLPPKQEGFGQHLVNDLLHLQDPLCTAVEEQKSRTAGREGGEFPGEVGLSLGRWGLVEVQLVGSEACIRLESALLLCSTLLVAAGLC